MSKARPNLPLAQLLPLAAFVWLISPSFYGLWQEAAPVASSHLPPLSGGQRAMLAPQMILEQLAYWLWPFGREPLTFTIQQNAILRQGLFFALILVLVIRFCWRLRRIEPWIFYGGLYAIVALVPFSGVFDGLVQPFSHESVLFAGMGLSLIFAALLLRAGQHFLPSEAAQSTRQKLSRLVWRLSSVALVAWVGALTLNLIIIQGRSWIERLDDLDGNSPDLVVAVEKARQLAYQGRFPEAESLILRCRQAAPWYPEATMVMAEITFLQGEYGASQEHIEHVLELAANHPPALDLQQEIRATPETPTAPPAGTSPAP